MSRRPSVRLAWCLVLTWAWAGVAAAATPPSAGACDPAQGRVEGAVPWSDQTESDWIYGVTTRYADVDGHRVHYPTPTAELAAALAARPEPEALRHLADARLALGDRAGALAALEKWGASRGAWAWADAAAWAEEHHELAFAISAAGKAIPCIDAETRKRLADDRVRWADAHPELADPIEMRRERAQLFPADGQVLESWIRALENAGRLADADRALAASRALTPERNLIVRADLAVSHHEDARAFDILDGAVEQDGWSDRFRVSYTDKTNRAHPELPEAWRRTLDERFDRGALIRLATYFQGAGRGLDTAELLRQVDRRYSEQFDRAGWLTLARLEGEIDAVAEAFRARLAAARLGTPEEQQGDLAALARLALAAGARPLALGNYDDEPYRWAARIDRTPGFVTGAISFLLTGGDWHEALANLEGQALASRTFATARMLAEELARRAPAHPELAKLRVAILERHVDRGEGKQALAIFRDLEPALAQPELDAARRVALLAMRQVETPVAEEARLYRERLKALAPDGARPRLRDDESSYRSEELVPPEDAAADESQVEIATWGRASMNPRPTETYARLLDEALSRLEDRDKSHRTSLSLVLGEMDRLPDDEDLWLELAKRLEGWNLDDDLGPRYQRAIAKFRGPTWWSRLARWYTRRARHQDLRQLTDQLVGQFRAAGIFARADLNGGAEQGGPARLEIPEQPRWGERIRLVLWADWVRLKALERFPHSPRVVREARQRLRLASDRSPERSPSAAEFAQPLVPDALLDEREWALLFVDPDRRERWFADAMRHGTLVAKLEAIEKRPVRTPVEETLLAEGWSRLSHFERASAPADRLSAAYPSDGTAVHRALSLHRSLQALGGGHAEAAQALVERSVAAVSDGSALLTELGEMEEERGRPHAASGTWRRILELDPRDPKRVEELATLYWDYEHMREALEVVEEGRKRLDEPRLLAFEAGVLREELRDIDGAVREYLAALDTRDEETEWRFPYSTVSDERAVRRLGTLLGRAKPRAAVLERIRSLEPGRKADEETLVALLRLVSVAPPYESDADREFLDWLIDRDELPHDPVAREQRLAEREARRPTERAGAVQVGGALLERCFEMMRDATSTEFLDAVQRWRDPLLDPRWGAGRQVAFDDTLAARRADLATTEVERVNREIERATALLDQGERAKADEVWKTLLPRLEKLPEGGAPIRAWVARAGYVERTEGAEPAERTWSDIAGRYPWSLGVLDDHLAFLGRVGRALDARTLLAAATERAASGHRESLLERLAAACLDARDLPCAERAARRLVEAAPDDLDETRRLAALGSLARARFATEPALDVLAFVNSVAARFQSETLPDVYAETARAADSQGAHEASVTAWIEALNRRTDRAWIREAMRGAERAGAAERLLAFFDRQRARSPRDVRWAIVVRELRLAAGDLEGAIEVSKAAVQVRPEKRELWLETAALIERAGRPREAADYLDGRDQLEPGNEELVRRRGELDARAGDLVGTPAGVAAAGQRIVALERAALGAFKKKGALDDDRKRELLRREGRAARRLLEFGYPQLAWSFLAGPTDRVAAVRASDLGAHEQARLALAAGKIVKLLGDPNLDAETREVIGRAVGSYARPEHKQQILGWLAARPLPVTKGVLGPEGQRTMDRWWSFAREAGLEDALRMTLARKGAASVPGPWAQGGVAAPFSFLSLYAEHIQITGSSPIRTELPSAEETWVEDLVARDEPAELAEFLAPRVRALMALVRGSTPLPSADRRLDWTEWVDGVTVFDTWCRGLEARPELLHELEDAFTESGRWNRFLALGGRHWPWRKLVELLPAATREEWFAVRGDFGPGWTEEGAPASVDPTTRRALAQALGGLVSGAAGSESSPLIAKLRGPRTVGEVLGHDPRFEWTAGGAARADTARFPRDLWGDRPGEAWYALESLARLRGGDASSWRVPLEVADRGAEADRKRVARAMALATSGPAEALTVDAAYRVGGGDLADVGWRARALVAAGKPDEASKVIEAEVAKQQPRLRPEGFRPLRRLAVDLGLPDPIRALDPSKPVGASLLAYLVDAVDLGAETHYTPSDVYDFRSALNARWRDRGGALTKEQVVLWLDELWAHGSGSLPREGLETLGGPWPAAADWLATQPETSRGAALAAVRALPADTAPLLALFPKPPAQRDEVTRLLWLRVCLARGEGAAALEQYGEILDEVASGAAAPTVSSSPSDDSEDEGYAEEEDGEESSGGDEYEEGSSGDDSTMSDTASVSGDAGAAARLRRWLDAIRAAKRAGGADVVAEAEARTLALLLDREGRDQGSAADWPLALELAADGAGRANVIARLERAWIRGDVAVTDLAPIVTTLARVAPEEAPRWLARWPLAFDEPSAQGRARLLARLGDRPAADALLSTARQRNLWSGPDEVRAFDAWRGLPAEQACDEKSGATCPPPAASRVPKTWTAAAAFWREPAAKVGADLSRHLDANPFDLLAARAALRAITTLDAETAARATRTLRDRTMQSFDTAGTDTDLLRLRAMRGLLPVSWRAADSVMTYVDPGLLVADLTRRRQRKTEIDASVADLARLHAAGGDPSATDLAMQVLEERSPAEAVKLRAELSRAEARTAPLPAYRLQNAVPRPYRPRDLDWTVVNLVATEAPR